MHVCSLLFLCMCILYYCYVYVFFIIVICMCSLLLLCMSILYYCYVCISGVQHRFFSCRHRLSDFILVHLCGTILAILNKVLMYFGMLDLSGSYWFYLVITALLVQLFCGVIKGQRCCINLHHIFSTVIVCRTISVYRQHRLFLRRHTDCAVLPDSLFL